MMENKCNKTPNNVNKNNNNNKFLDHVYCTSETKNIRTANNNNNASGGGGGGGAGGDLLALLKENKKLKTMLILHLDLIQEQSDQLISKDKQLLSVNEEADLLRTRNVQLEAQVEELQKQLQRQIKRAASSTGELCTLPPPPLAKIQCKAEAVTTATASGKGKAAATGNDSNIKTLTSSKSGGKAIASTNIIGECNGKLISKIILHRVAMPGRRGRSVLGSDEVHSPNSSSASESTSDADDSTQKSRQDLDYEEEELDEEEEEDDEDDEDVEDDDEDLVEEVSSNGTEDSNDVYNEHSKRKRQRKTANSVAAVSRGAKPRQALTLTPPHSTSTSTTTTVTTTTAIGSKTLTAPMQVCITPPTPTPSRGKQMPLMMWHAPEPHETDESASCDSMADNDKLSQTATSPTGAQPSADGSTSGGRDLTNISDSKRSNQSSNLAPPATQGSHLHAKSRRCAYISTPQLYCTREWEDEEFICDYEFIKEEADALHADTPNLEIPKWTEHELTVSYSIEGTEDLCDDTFLKRHAKFETDEKRRKKWDVQQIREQRRIEKLKRRHCKDELQQAPEPQPLLSFYPPPDTIQTICYISDLPVQAFGEIIPKLQLGDADFTLPWLSETNTSAASTSATTGSTANTTTNTMISSHYKPVVTLASTTTPSAQAGSGAATGSGGSGSSAHTQLQHLNSSFVFLKKRRRQQSSSMTTATTPTARQRSVAAAKVTTAQTNASPSRL